MYRHILNLQNCVVLWRRIQGVRRIERICALLHNFQHGEMIEYVPRVELRLLELALLTMVDTPPSIYRMSDPQ